VCLAETAVAVSSVAKICLKRRCNATGELQVSVLELRGKCSSSLMCRGIQQVCKLGFLFSGYCGHLLLGEPLKSSLLHPVLLQGLVDDGEELAPDIPARWTRSTPWGGDGFIEIKGRVGFKYSPGGDPE
jgi:hypothetical protein